MTSWEMRCAIASEVFEMLAIIQNEKFSDYLLSSETTVTTRNGIFDSVIVKIGNIERDYATTDYNALVANRTYCKDVAKSIVNELHYYWSHAIE